MIVRIVLFIAVNFAALVLGGLFTETGVTSEWYLGLSKAPWTPPGWVFGAAWTTIMVCFAIYMALAMEKVANTKKLLALFSIQWVLNVLWNPVFFYFHYVTAALIIIVALTMLIAGFLFRYGTVMQFKSVLLAPYFIWLLIATSLNAYIWWYN